MLQAGLRQASANALALNSGTLKDAAGKDALLAQHQLS